MIKKFFLKKQVRIKEHIVLLCGRYEGVDERVRLHVATEELSIGDYVVSGGELPACIVLDAVARQVPGVVGDADSVTGDSFVRHLLDYPHYTRPEALENDSVPEVLLSGDHAEIRRWRKQQALKRTLERRPDLLAELDVGELDICGGHAGRGDDYHYPISPKCLIEK